MSWPLLLGSLVAVLVIAGIARLLRLGGTRKLDDQAQAVEAARLALPFYVPREAFLDRHGRGALLFDETNHVALLRPHGMHWVARQLRRPVRATVEGDCLIVASGERMFGDLRLETSRAAELAGRLGAERDAAA